MSIECALIFVWHYLLSLSLPATPIGPSTWPEMALTLELFVHRVPILETIVEARDPPMENSRPGARFQITLLLFGVVTRRNGA